MFKALFSITLIVTSTINLIFLFATKDKPPDLLSSTTFASSSSRELTDSDTVRTTLQLTNSSNTLVTDVGNDGRRPISSSSLQTSLQSQGQRRLLIRSNEFYDYYSSGQKVQPSVDKDDQWSKSRGSRDSPPGWPFVTTNHNESQSNSMTVTTRKSANGFPAQINLADEANNPPQPAAGSNIGRDSSARPQLSLIDNDELGRARGVREGNETSEATKQDYFAQVEETQTTGGDNQKRLFGLLPFAHTKGPKANSTSPPLFELPKSMSQKRNDQIELDSSSGRRPIESIELKNNTIDSGADSEPPAVDANSKSKLNGPYNELKIRVKSSKNHVFVSVDNVLIYESRTTRGPGTTNRAAVARGRPSARIYFPTTKTAKTTTEQSATYDDGEDPSPDDQLQQQQQQQANERGIHLVVLNQFNGQLMARRVFDTYLPNQDDELCLFLGMIRSGRILVFAVKDEGSFKMAKQSAARRLLGQLGSRHIQQLAWRNMWAFVTTKRTFNETDVRLGQPLSFERRQEQPKPAGGDAGEPTNELLSKPNDFANWAEPVFLETTVPLATATNDQQWECAWPNENTDDLQRRRLFCSQVEGYGRVCDCAYPSPISFEPKQIPNSQLAGIPIVVIASNRAYYLYRMLRSLLQADGVEPAMVTVFIDGFYEEPLAVCKLFNLRAIQHTPRGRSSLRISHHYKTSLASTFDQLFPRAQFAIIFEEDLDVARDALLYFSQTKPLLEADPSLYCVSTWNDQGYEHSVGHDAGLVYRIETMPGLGWMLSRRLFKEELEPRWPSSEQPHDWDMWIRTQPVRRGRECLIPDISKTFHFGSMGTNINSYFQRQYFQKHAFMLASDAKEPTQFQLGHLKHDDYEEMVAELIGQANVIRAPPDLLFNATAAAPTTTNRTTNLLFEFACSLMRPSVADDVSHLNSTTKANVIFIKMIDQIDFKNWLKLAQCWRIWDLDARGQHKSMWRLFLQGKQTFVVGTPASPYSRLKPIDLMPFNFV